MPTTELCSNLRANGSCLDPLCAYQHGAHICEPCGFVSAAIIAYNAHLVTREHINRIQGESSTLRCSVCNRFVPGMKNWLQHVQGLSHRQAAGLRGVLPTDVEPEETDSMPGHVYCATCNLHIQEKHWNGHSKRSQHLEKEKFAAFKTVLDDAQKDKHGITVSENVDFGVIEIQNAVKGISHEVGVKTTVPTSRVALVEAKLASAKGVTLTPSGFSVSISKRTISHLRPLSIIVTLRHNHFGRYQDRLELVFEDLQLQKQFVITRDLHVIIGDKADYESLKPKAPYKPRKHTSRQPEIDVVEGISPPALKAIPYIVDLTHARIPSGLSATLTSGTVSDILERVKRIYLPSAGFSGATYGRHFKTLLWVEELRMEHDLGMYDMSNAKMTTHGLLYFLEVPGLAENRPSVLVGDSILLQKHGAKEGHWFEGGVHVVRQKEVGLRFHHSFRGWTKDQLYNVRFRLNRIPLRRQHQALDTAFSPDRVLFPVNTGPLVAQLDVRLSIFNPLIAGNAPQLDAVKSIVKQKPGDVPFIIFGPPGTGKTVTMVEAIRQVLRKHPGARVLACAPSNSAADLIASRLTALGTKDLFRLYAPSRNKAQVPDELLPFTYVRREDGNLGMESLDSMKRFRIVVTTCVSASFAHNIGIPRGHFSHIFVDEAGQATEPEVMIGIKTMCDNSTNVILSGDHKQLGPIIRSPIARKLGLEISFLERLMGRELYSAQVGSRNVVKLVKNFRSHSAILRFPNERFYNGDLVPCGDSKVINSYLDSPLLPSKRFPIVFHSISGQDLREASSPSFFNIDEVTQVKQWVAALRSDRHTRITDNDIGIITPYHSQCLKIRAALRAVADGVKVGSVEEFQGQERRVIIISTVRSSKEFVEYDLKHTLGFVANPRRFNVAVTRAKALLIVVGDPSVLSLDPLWRSFLNYVFVNGGWKGPPPSWDTRAAVKEKGGYDQEIREAALRDMNEFTRRIEALTLAGAEPGIDDDEAVDANVDRPWRDTE